MLDPIIPTETNLHPLTSPPTTPRARATSAPVRPVPALFNDSSSEGSAAEELLPGSATVETTAAAAAPAPVAAAASRTDDAAASAFAAIQLVPTAEQQERAQREVLYYVALNTARPAAKDDSASADNVAEAAVQSSDLAEADATQVEVDAISAELGRVQPEAARAAIFAAIPDAATQAQAARAAVEVEAVAGGRDAGAGVSGSGGPGNGGSSLLGRIAKVLAATAVIAAVVAAYYGRIKVPARLIDKTVLGYTFPPVVVLSKMVRQIIMGSAACAVALGGVLYAKKNSVKA